MDEDVTKIVGYHGTDRSCVESILRDGFKWKRKDEHWLGEGAYFYIDEELARWWSTNPTNRFGVYIKDPVIIQSIIIYKQKKCVDLRDLNTYRFVAQEFQNFIRIANVAIKKKKRLTDLKKLRCAFFNQLKRNYDIEIVIGVFPRYEGRYIGENTLSDIKMPYAEVQICVSDTSLIHKSEVLDGG